MSQTAPNNTSDNHQLSIVEAGQPSRTIALAGAATIGRDAESDIVLAAATVSRQHALLLHDDCGMLLLDLDSTNGTLVNDVPAQPDQPVRLADGDTVRFGQVVARYGRKTKDE